MVPAVKKYPAGQRCFQVTSLSCPSVLPQRQKLQPVIGGEVAVDAEALARRAERFGTTTPAASTAATAEAKRKRAAKFGMSSGDPDESPNKKSKGE